MTQLADVIIPSFSSDVVQDLPAYYRVMAHHLANTGRLVITDSSEKTEGK
jgi:hypothetical protein